MKIPKIYEVDPVTGYTVDGLFLGIPKGPDRPMPDVYHHPGPLPQLKPTSVDMRLNTRTAMDHPSASKRAIAQRIASFDEKHAEEMRKFYGDPKLDPENDGARISWATKIEPPEPEIPKVLTPEEIAILHGEDTLRKLNARH